MNRLTGLVAKGRGQVPLRSTQFCGEDVEREPLSIGGWILSPSGSKANFAVARGIKNGADWGHLQYIDHGNGPTVKGTGVTAYTVTGPTTRHIEGTADIDGMPGTYQVDVADNGEPGGDDTFTLTLSTGYSASAFLSGGNIQLHQPCQ